MKFAVIFAMALTSTYVLPHSGGTDSQGCHVDRRTGVRHCH